MGGHIAHPVGVGQGTSQQAQQVGHLIGSGVVGTHQGVGRIQRTVQDADLGVLGRHLQAGGVHPGTGGKHHVYTVVGQLLQCLLGVHLRVHVLQGGGGQPVREGLFQGVPALVVVPDPGTVLGVVLVEEGHLQLTGLGAEDVQLGQQRLAGTGGRLQGQFHRLRLRKHLHLGPQFFQVLLHLGRGGLAGVGVPIHRQIHQQAVAGGQLQVMASQGNELLPEHGVKGRKVQSVVLGPAFPRGLAHQGLELGIASGAAEVHIVDLGQLIKIQKLVVDPVFQAVVPGRDQPGDSAGDLYRPIVFQHRHPLVALLDIEAVHELVGQNGVLDALFQVGLAEVGPLGGKLGVCLQQRHEVGRKGRVPSAGLGAHDALSRDLHQTQRLL